MCALSESEAFGLGKRQQDLAFLWRTAQLNEQDQLLTISNYEHSHYATTKAFFKYGPGVACSIWRS